MRLAAIERRSPATVAPAEDLQARVEGALRRLSDAVDSARTGAAKLIERVPATIDATRAGASRTTSALQTLPDPTLRSLVATSVGLGAGFYLAGAPRLAVVAGVAPALLAGAAIVLRPIEASLAPESGAPSRTSARRGITS